MFLFLLFLIFIIICIPCFLLGKTVAAKEDNCLSNFLRRHPAIGKAVLLGYVVFAGCFVFPIRSEPFPIDFWKIYQLVCCYGIIGLGFAGIYRACRERFVYLSALFLTIAGMICRYFLEYGEVSNTYNFTAVNIISFLVLIPAFTAFAYHLWVKYLVKNK